MLYCLSALNKRRHVELLFPKTYKYFFEIYVCPITKAIQVKVQYRICVYCNATEGKTAVQQMDNTHRRFEIKKIPSARQEC